MINEKDLEKLIKGSKTIKDTPLYVLRETVLNDTCFVVFQPLLKGYKPLIVMDNDNNVKLALTLFDEELKMRLFTFKPQNIRSPKMEVLSDKVLLYTDKKIEDPDRIRRLSARWDFLFKYKIRFKNLILKTKRNEGLMLEIRGNEYIDAIYTILNKKERKTNKNKYPIHKMHVIKK